ncbi:MAG: glycosyltransferase family 39 protein [Candidatus Binatia bacterium]
MTVGAHAGDARALRGAASGVRASAAISPWLIAAGIALVAALVHAGTLGGGYPLDDEIQVENNVFIRSLAGALGIFGRETWPGYVYRPLPTFTYALTYAIAGDSPWLYHLTSILLHAAASVLVWLCVRRVLDDDVAALAGLLFAVHPAHVEAIASIANRTELLVAVCGLGGLLVVLPSSDGRRWSVAETGARLVAGALLFLGALLSKESAATLFLLLPVLVATRRDSDLLDHGVASARFGRGMLRDARVGVAALVLASVTYFVLRSRVLTRVLADSVIAPIDNWLVTVGPLDRMLRAFALLGRYVTILVAPHGLSADYSSGTHGVLRDLAAPDSLLYLATAIAVLAATLLGLRRRSRLWIFVGGWFFASFAITSNVAFPIGVVFADRLSYLPSVAICALLAWMLLRVSSTPVRRAVTAGVVVVFAGLSVSYGQVWKDNRTLFLYELRTSPESAWVHAGLGNELLRAGAPDAARAHFLEALRIHPTHMHAAHGIALIELAEGDRTEGRAWLERALSFDPGFAPSLEMLGTLELEDGRVDEAGRLFVRALNADGSRVQARVGLLAATLRRGNLAQAAAMRDELMALDASRADLRELSEEIDRRQAALHSERSGSEVRG